MFALIPTITIGESSGNGAGHSCRFHSFEPVRVELSVAECKAQADDFSPKISHAAFLPLHFAAQEITLHGTGLSEHVAVRVQRLDVKLALERIDVDAQLAARDGECTSDDRPFLLTSIERDEAVSSQHCQGDRAVILQIQRELVSIRQFESPSESQRGVVEPKLTVSHDHIGGAYDLRQIVGAGAHW